MEGSLNEDIGTRSYGSQAIVNKASKGILFVMPYPELATQASLPPQVP